MKTSILTFLARLPGDITLGELRALGPELMETFGDQPSAPKVKEPVPKPKKEPSPPAHAQRGDFPASVKMKKDGTPDLRSLKPALRKARESGVRLKKDGTLAKKPGKKPNPKPQIVDAAPPPEVTPAVIQTQKDPYLPFVTNLKEVIGSDTLHIDDILDRLRQRDALPEAKDVKRYAVYFLNDPRYDVFEKASEKGFYRVRDNPSNGRVSIKDCLVSVLGSEALHIGSIITRLEEHKWMPKTREPRKYIGFVLSQSKELFETVPSRGRGYYRSKVVPVRPEDEDDLMKEAEKYFPPCE